MPPTIMQSLKGLTPRSPFASRMHELGAMPGRGMAAPLGMMEALEGKGLSTGGLPGVWSRRAEGGAKPLLPGGVFNGGPAGTTPFAGRMQALTGGKAQPAQMSPLRAANQHALSAVPVTAQGPRLAAPAAAAGLLAAGIGGGLATDRGEAAVNTLKGKGSDLAAGQLASVLSPGKAELDPSKVQTPEGGRLPTAKPSPPDKPSPPKKTMLEGMQNQWQELPNWGKGLGLGAGALGTGLLAHKLLGQEDDEEEGSSGVPYAGLLAGLGAGALGARHLSGGDYKQLLNKDFWLNHGKQGAAPTMIAMPKLPAIQRPMSMSHLMPRTGNRALGGLAAAAGATGLGLAGNSLLANHLQKADPKTEFSPAAQDKPDLMGPMQDVPRMPLSLDLGKLLPGRERIPAPTPEPEGAPHPGQELMPAPDTGEGDAKPGPDGPMGEAKPGPEDLTSPATQGAYPGSGLVDLLKQHWAGLSTTGKALTLGAPLAAGAGAGYLASRKKKRTKVSALILVGRDPDFFVPGARK